MHCAVGRLHDFDVVVYAYDPEVLPWAGGTLCAHHGQGICIQWADFLGFNGCR